jgi:hypothetical protein
MVLSMSAGGGVDPVPWTRSCHAAACLSKSRGCGYPADAAVWPASLKRHHQGVAGELGADRAAHRPPDDPPRPQIKHGGQVEPPFADAELGHVRGPHLIRGGWIEVAPDQICPDDRAGRPGRAPAAATMHANLPVLAHQANNPLAAAVHAEPGTLGMHTRHAVGAAGPLIIAVIAWLSCAPALCRAEGGPAGEGAEPERETPRTRQSRLTP